MPRKPSGPILEQDIYIPYEKLRQVFEKHGRGVFLPYEKFQELWQAAQDKTRPAAEAKPPVGALITEIENEATVEKDVVRVKAKVKIEVLAEGWNEISLRLADAAITGATLDGKPARIIGAPGQDYRLLVEKKGKQPEQMTLDLEYAKAITRTPGQNSVSFQAPQAPVSRWQVTIPQAGVKVNLHPLIAATEVPAEKKPDGEAPRRPTRRSCWPSSAPPRWCASTGRPRPKGATGLAAMASVQAEQQVWISEGVVRTRTTLAYAISRAELAQLMIDVPADQKVVNVFDANVRQWSVEPVEGRQRITAQLFEPAKNAQQVTVELEKFAGEKAKRHDRRAGGQGGGRGPAAGRAWWSRWPRACGPRPPRPAACCRSMPASCPPRCATAQVGVLLSLRRGRPSSWRSSVEKVQPRITVDSLVRGLPRARAADAWT